MRLAFGAAVVQMWRDMSIWLPQPVWLLGRCGKLWPCPAYSVTPLPTSPSQGWRMEGAGRGEPGQGGHPQHLHHRSETCLEPWLDKYFFAKDTQGVTLCICYPLCSATGESLASLFQGAGWSLGMDTGALLGRSLGRQQVFP